MIRRPRAPTLRFIAWRATGAQRLGGEGELDVLELEHRLVLAHEGVLRLGQDPDQGVLVELLKGRHDRQAADELGNQGRT